MKMVKKFIYSIAILGATLVSNAQQGPFGYYRDALTFGQSNTAFGSTARMQAIGGSQTALGGDLSSISSNPAGLGFFNKSLFALTPALDFISADTEFQGQGEESFKNNFHFANIGTVINFTKGDYTNDKFKGGSLGISLSRMNEFHLERNYEGANDFNSIIDSFLETAGQTATEDLGGFELGAFDQYVINPVFDANDNVTGYDSFVLGLPIQTESIQGRGSHYQLNVAWGGNYDDKYILVGVWASRF